MHGSQDCTTNTDPEIQVHAYNPTLHIIATWPTSQGTIDLGNRVLDVLAIPGHEVQHIALYDRKTGILFTGDTLYPGLLFISDWETYRTSVHRLAAFAAAHPVSHILGAHIEMTSTPKQVYPYGTTYQPAEHVLELSVAQLAEPRRRTHAARAHAAGAAGRARRLRDRPALATDSRRRAAT